jgi:hypothetical protein
MKGPKGEWSVFALNRDNQPLPITLNGLPSNTTFDVVCWNANGDGKLTNDTRQTSDAKGQLTVAIAKESLISLKRIGN